jgi:predicted transcriptional regulator
MLVHDARGLGREAWGLEEKNAAVIILDPAGKVLFARQGKLQPHEIEMALDLLRGS